MWSAGEFQLAVASEVRVPTRTASGDSNTVFRIEDVLERLGRDYSRDDVELVRRAHEFSSEAHRDQVRRSGSPYVDHPIAVAAILCDLHLDVVCIVVGLLHDVLEDTKVTGEQLRAEFGGEVTTLVEGVTKIGRMEFNSQLEQQAVNFRKLLLAMVEDVRVLLVKLADRLHNMRTLGYLRPSSRRRIASETIEIYAPLAHRLGMGRIQSELEDIAFRYLEPDAFERLRAQVAGRLRAARGFTARIKEQVEQTMKQHDIPCRVMHRVKGLSSLHQKMEARDLELDQVYDLVAFRIITDTVRNCYGALGIIHNDWNPVPGRFKDFIAMPKPNMYQSLHTALLDAGRPFEVQIRTEEMHRVAEEGIAAHWLYKEGEKHSTRETEPLVWLRQLVEWQRDVSDPREFLSSLKLNLYPDEVYVFTPKGEVKALPRGSTAVDFAYMIHTQIGEHCAGAKINGKLAPLKQTLRNGDIVEIVTSSEASPSRDWLQLAQTTRARNRIRGFLNKQQRARSLELGRKMCDKEFRKYGLRLKKLMADGTIERVAGQLGLGGAEDLLVAVSFGKVGVRPLVERILPSEELESRRPTRRSPLRRWVDKAMGWSAADAIQVEGIDGIMVYRARCCGPVPGEPIVGYVTRGKGVSVHGASCKNIERLLEAEDRRIEVVWTPPEGSAQPVRLRVEVDDRAGMLAALTSKIAAEGSNIRRIESNKTTSYKTRIDLVLEVHDRAHLQRIVRTIGNTNGVRSVRRGRAP